MKGDVYGIGTGDGGYLCDLREPDGCAVAEPLQAAQQTAREQTAGDVLGASPAVLADQRNLAYWAARHGKGGGLNR